MRDILAWFGLPSANPVRDEVHEVKRARETSNQINRRANARPARVGYETTGALLSGKTKRHRLNRAGDRQGNSALWIIVVVRIRSNHQPTINYIERRTAEGRSVEKSTSLAFTGLRPSSGSHVGVVWA